MYIRVTRPQFFLSRRGIRGHKMTPATVVALLLLSQVITAAEPDGKATCGMCQCSNGHNGLNGRNGKDGAKGEKGDPGTIPSVGNIIFVESQEQCIKSIAGKVKYNTERKGLDFCNGKSWLPLSINSGITRTSAAKSCLELKKEGKHHGSDLYWLDPTGGSRDDAFQAFCDMETQGGGWTLFATKVSPDFNFISTTFSANAARSTLDNAASCIHPRMRSWTEVMFRFATRSDIYVIYNRNGGGHSPVKTRFDNFLMCQVGSFVSDVPGFYKYSPADASGRVPSSGYATVRKIHHNNPGRMTEDHDGSDKWIDLGKSPDGSNNYHHTDNSAAVGTKCLAGYCFLKAPVWVMVR